MSYKNNSLRYERKSAAERLRRLHREKSQPRFSLPHDKSMIERWAKDPEFSQYLRKQDSRRAVPAAVRPVAQNTLEFKLMKAQYAAQQACARIGVSWTSMR